MEGLQDVFLDQLPVAVTGASYSATEGMLLIMDDRVLHDDDMDESRQMNVLWHVVESFGEYIGIPF